MIAVCINVKRHQLHWLDNDRPIVVIVHRNGLATDSLCIPVSQKSFRCRLRSTTTNQLGPFAKLSTYGHRAFVIYGPKKKQFAGLH